MTTEQNKYRMLVDNLPVGFAYHRIVTDDSGNPVDYIFLDVNDAFCKMTGLQKEAVLGKKVTGVLPGIEESAFDWIGTYGKVALGGGPARFNSYSEQLERWYEVTAYSDEADCFAVLIHETTAVEKTKSQLIKTARLAEEFLSITSKELDYQAISDHLLELAGAKYVVFNLYDDEGKTFTTVALSGDSEQLDKATALLGFQLAGKTWPHDPQRDDKTRGRLITRFSGLVELVGNILPPETVELMEKTLQTGEILIVQIKNESRIIGDFAIVMETGQQLENNSIVEIFTRQVGLVLTRKKTEETLRFLSSVTKNMTDSIVVTNTSFAITYLNKKAEELYGYSLDELAGQTPGIFNAEPLSEQIQQDLYQTVAAGKAYLGESLNRRKDGTTFLCEYKVIPLYNDNGDIYAYVGIQRDITRQKEQEQQLQRSEKRLKDNEERLNTLISQTPAVIYSFKFIEGIPAITYINDNITHLFGFKPEEFINNTEFFIECIHPEDVGKVLGAIPKLMTEDRVNLEPYRFKDKWGNYHWLHDEQRLHSHEDGTQEVIGACWDITDRKQAEEALRESEQRYDLAIAGTGAGLWDWDMVNNSVYFSRRWKEMLGYQEEEVENTFSGWKKLWHPADGTKIEQAVREHLAGKTEKYEVEHRLRDRQGNWRWILTRGDLIRDEEGKPVRWIGTNIDLTHIKEIEEELLRSQQHFASMVQTQHEMISRFLPDTTITFVNEAYCRYFDAPYEELVGKKFLELIPEEEHGAVMEKLSGLNKENPFQTYSHPVILRDGSKGWQEWTDQVILDTTGNVVEIQSTGRDITIQQQYAEELKRSNADLEQFAYAISHDMRQPLRMVNSYLQLLEKDLGSQLNEDTSEYLHFALDGAKRMDQMILALLEYSRVGRKYGAREQIESREALEEALLFLEPEIREAGAELQIEGEWPSLYATFDEMSRLFQNLISNGIKYREQGKKPEITIAVQRDGPDWLFSVRDNGIGIDPSQVERLFKVFSRLHSRSHYAGTGVGLALCRKIVENHGGRIWVESPGPGAGSTFYFTLKE